MLRAASNAHARSCAAHCLEGPGLSATAAAVAVGSLNLAAAAAAASCSPRCGGEQQQTQPICSSAASGPSGHRSDHGSQHHTTTVLHGHSLKEHLERKHHSHRAPWLRAFVLGASDGLVSTAALLTGVGAAHMEAHMLITTGVAGLVAGSMSMAVGEYISVSSQRDAEQADIEIERRAHATAEGRRRELEELTIIYKERGLELRLARQVAEALTEHDALRAHARDELGIDIDELANPLQAAVVSAFTFAAGAGLPLAAAMLVDDPALRNAAVAGVATLGLAGFGCLSARLGGASMLMGGARVVAGGWAAMLLTYGVGSWFDVAMA